MYIISTVFLTVVILTTAEGSFVNPYPRYKFYEDNGDPGEPLFLTKYIENGDIETVSTQYSLVWQLKNTCIGKTID